MNRQKRIEYLTVTVCVFFTSFILYGSIGTIKPYIEDSYLKSFLLLGCGAGLGFSAILSTVIFAIRFFQYKTLKLKTIASLIWPLTLMCLFFVGMLFYIPYQVYNAVKIIQERK